VLDPSLSGPLSLVAKTTYMKEHDVEKIYILGPRLETTSKVVIYLVRPTMETMQMVAAHIRDHGDRGQKKEYQLVFVPRRTMICERVLEDKGVYADVTIRELHMDLVALDVDVLTLDMASSFFDVWNDDDSTSLFYTARALMKMQVLALFILVPFSERCLNIGYVWVFPSCSSVWSQGQGGGRDDVAHATRDGRRRCSGSAA
jgi:hypothetical protein